jgi:hypothetical protein
MALLYKSTKIGLDTLLDKSKYQYTMRKTKVRGMCSAVEL